VRNKGKESKQKYKILCMKNRKWCQRKRNRKIVLELNVLVYQDHEIVAFYKIRVDLIF
jgi:hypothetical protein